MSGGVLNDLWSGLRDKRTWEIVEKGFPLRVVEYAPEAVLGEGFQRIRIKLSVGGGQSYGAEYAILDTEMSNSPDAIRELILGRRKEALLALVAEGVGREGRP